MRLRTLAPPRPTLSELRQHSARQPNKKYTAEQAESPPFCSPTYGVQNRHVFSRTFSLLVLREPKARQPNKTKKTKKKTKNASLNAQKKLHVLSANVRHVHLLCPPTYDVQNVHLLCPPTYDVQNVHLLCPPTYDVQNVHLFWRTLSLLVLRLRTA